MNSMNCLTISLIFFVNIYFCSCDLPVPDNATIAKANVDVAEAKEEVARLRTRATNVENAEMVVSRLLNEIRDLDPEIVKDLLRLGEISIELPAKVRALETILNATSVTAPPSVTTAPPAPQTTPPATAPPATTALPVTTQPPVVTTQPPVVTTQPPVVTTGPPPVTTQPPVVTTTRPVCICFADLVTQAEIDYAQQLVNMSKEEIHRLRTLANEIEKAEKEVSILITEIDYLDPDIVTDLKRLAVIAQELPDKLKALDVALIKGRQ